MSDGAITLGDVLRNLQHPGIDDPVYLAFWLGLPLMAAWWIELRYWPRARGRPETRLGLLMGTLVSLALAYLLYAYLYEALRTGVIYCVSISRRAGRVCQWRCEYGDIGCAMIKPPRGRASMHYTPVHFWAGYIFFAAIFLTPLLAWALVCLKAFGSWWRMPWRFVAWRRRA